MAPGLGHRDRRDRDFSLMHQEVSVFPDRMGIRKRKCQDSTGRRDAVQQVASPAGRVSDAALPPEYPQRRLELGEEADGIGAGQVSGSEPDVGNLKSTGSVTGSAMAPAIKRSNASRATTYSVSTSLIR